jgi:hypothetical protein
VVVGVRRREQGLAHRIAEPRRAVAQRAVHLVKHDLRGKNEKRKGRANTPVAKTDTRKWE